MPRHLKRGVDASAIKAADAKVRETVEQILADIEARKDAAVRELSQKFDNWSPASFKLTSAEVERAIAQVRKRDLDDIRFAQAQVRNFAQKQRETLRDLEVETLPGIVLGHRHIPVNSIGCYVPGGRYPMVASAHMSIVTARVAGVRHIIACAPPFKGGPHPAIVAAMHFGGADEIFVLGGVQAVAAMALGTETIAAVDMIVGPGNAYVAEAKRQLFGRVWHRSSRRPDRDADHRRRQRRRRNVRDRSARSGRAWADLAGDPHHQFGKAGARHHEGSRAAARGPADRRHRRQGLGGFRRGHRLRRRGGDGARGRPRRLRARAGDDARSVYFFNSMHNYGSLFLGPRTNVAYGDKVIGTNHTLPTRKAARYTGGLWVGKFLKTCTYQKVNSDAASSMIGEYCSRLCMLEGFVAHAEQANVRVRRYGGRNVPYAHARGVSLSSSTVSSPALRGTMKAGGLANVTSIDLANTPSFRLDGRRALVTGGGRGSGLRRPRRWPRQARR